MFAICFSKIMLWSIKRSKNPIIFAKKFSTPSGWKIQLHKEVSNSNKKRLDNQSSAAYTVVNRNQ